MVVGIVVKEVVMKIVLLVLLRAGVTTRELTGAEYRCYKPRLRSFYSSSDPVLPAPLRVGPVVTPTFPRKRFRS